MQFQSAEGYERGQNGVCVEKCVSGAYVQKDAEFICTLTAECEDGLRRIADGQG